MLIKPLSDVFNIVHQHVTRAVQSAAVVTSFGVRGAQSMASGVRGSHGASSGMRGVQSGSEDAPGWGSAVKDNLLSGLGGREAACREPQGHSRSA